MITVTQFLYELMDGILKREQDNENMIYLYYVNGTWSAIERSAYFLSQMVACEVITLLAQDHEEAPEGQIVLASVSDTMLRTAVRSYSVVRHSLDHLILRPINIPTHYAEWHQGNLVQDLDDDDLEDA